MVPLVMGSSMLSLPRRSLILTPTETWPPRGYDGTASCNRSGEGRNAFNGFKIRNLGFPFRSSAASFQHTGRHTMWISKVNCYLFSYFPSPESSICFNNFLLCILIALQ